MNSILSTKIVQSNRTNEVDFRLDMNVVIVKLTENSVLVWPNLNVLLSVVLTTKYSILQKITIANWMTRLHISYISKDFVVLLYVMGTDVSFDIANVIF